VSTAWIAQLACASQADLRATSTDSASARPGSAGVGVQPPLRAQQHAVQPQGALCRRAVL
jgi:hypothetical protein